MEEPEEEEEIEEDACVGLAVGHQAKEQIICRQNEKYIIYYISLLFSF